MTTDFNSVTVGVLIMLISLYIVIQFIGILLALFQILLQWPPFLFLFLFLHRQSPMPATCVPISMKTVALNLKAS